MGWRTNRKQDQNDHRPASATIDSDSDSDFCTIKSNFLPSPALLQRAAAGYAGMCRLHCRRLTAAPLTHRRNPTLPLPTAQLPSSISPASSFFTSSTPDSADECSNFYDSMIKSCSSLQTLKQVHSSLISSGLVREDPHLSGQVIIKYSKYGECEDSRSLFDSVVIDGTNSFLWNTMIRAYSNAGQFIKVLAMYSLMLEWGVSPNNYTYPFVLKACGSRVSVVMGRLVHGHVVKSGFELDVYVEAGLVDMYAKCGEVEDGRRVFDGMTQRDVVAWTAMITAYEQAERAKDSLQLFCEMHGESFVADGVAVVSVASAVGQLCDLGCARSVHAHAIRKDLLEDLVVENALVAMYSKCGEVKTARMVFDGIVSKDGISWNSMLSGYLQNGLASEALSLFDKMVASQVRPNSVTGLIIASACAYLGSLHLGRKIHSTIINSDIKIDTTLWNAIMDMYSKCGDLDTTIQMFHSRPLREVNDSTWNVMISGYGMHGRGSEALELFSRMQEEGVEPNHITFTCLLSACSHAGLVDEGRKLFEEMRKKLYVKPTVKHYACMVDLLARAGFFKEACSLIEEMPYKPNDGIWGALLGACKIHKNAQLGEFAAKNLFQLEPEHAGYYVLMSNIYAASNKWNEVGNLRQLIKGRGMKKPAAFSVIEIGKEIHGFHTSDRSHPQWSEVYKRIESLIAEIKMVGYVPDNSCVLHDVEEEDKGIFLCYHSEKLVVAFGLMKIGGGLPIYVTKNLRVCDDCHSALKFISQFEKRKIIVRDANRFHHFQDGACSCKDYW